MQRPLLVAALLLLLAVSCATKRTPGKCWPKCSCGKGTVICKSAVVPRNLPLDATSLTFDDADFNQIANGTFSHLPTLHVLLLGSSSFSIRDDAFKGLVKLHYLFIENNIIDEISRNAFRGLKTLTHLSLANNKLRSLPRDVFKGLDAMTDVDLRGNALHCDCKMKWLVSWLHSTNASVHDITCASPPEFAGRSTRSLSASDFSCITTEFVLWQTLPMQSMSVETFPYKGEVNVVVAQPLVGNCTVLEWDHVERVFRVFDNITGQSIISCKPIVIEGQIFVIVAQLFGGSHIYKRDEHSHQFIKIQDIDTNKIRKPNDVETFDIKGEHFAVIAESSKAGVTTLYRWNGNGFYSLQSLHHWYRDTDAEFVEIAGKPMLILASSSQVPVIYQWDFAAKQFLQNPRSDIPETEDVIGVKSFSMGDDLYVCLTRFIGDSKVMKWDGLRFTEVQALPSRGSMVLQPLSVGPRQYAVLGSDFAFSQVYLWDAEAGAFAKLQPLNVQAPRAFTIVSMDKGVFLFASSFTDSTKIFQHRVIDLSL
ncbi:leucine-rich glioma-inactivated protein 1 [Petromyzon marinus]|uniref:Leucine-rich glioma-inactivated protein 1 n=1 Tax=Petromyzon marinus TaxID=7757 RepID=A0AAJ7WS67_PETMA|nr:leucine-rich glioma-inactivated protein 1 [Petromyzon marinus]